MVFMVMVVVMVMMMMLMLFVVIVVIMVMIRLLQFCNPGSRCCHAVEIKHARTHNLIKIYVAIVASKDLCLRLQSLHDALHLCKIFCRHHRSLVEDDDVTEFYLLDYQTCDVLFADVVAHEVVATIKLVAHSQCIHDSGDAVEFRCSVLCIIWCHGRDGAYGLCDWNWFADAARLHHDIVKLAHCGDVAQLLHQVHLQRAADASVLQSHERIVLLVYHTALLYEVCVYVDLTDIVHDNGKLIAFLIGQYSVQQGCLSTSQIAGKKQYRNFFVVHNYRLVLFV